MITMELDDKYNWDNPDSEEDEVRLIKKYLRTPEQKAALDAADLSIEDILNGRFGGAHEALINGLFADWNQRLGTKRFGY